MRLIVSTLLLTCLWSCMDKNKQLPYLGQPVMVDGKQQQHTVGDWAYVNQDSALVTNKDLSQKIYIADFFFTSCPSICPKVMKQMLRIHDEFKNNDNVQLVSFTLDPKRDNVSKLRLYGNNLGVESKNWWFLSGEQDATMDLANKFFVTALKDDSVPGGFDHSGKIILVDKNGHVRSFSEGTDESKTPQFIEDVYKLLNEK